MNHNLFLGMYSFRIKKKFSKNETSIDNNDFLSVAYPDETNKFSEGFSQEIINLIDGKNQKTFKNNKNTHGAILENYKIDPKNRTLDLLINGGITEIKQFLIDETGSKEEISDKITVGLKFYFRIWLPANSKSGYIFIQKYGTLSIKPIVDAIIKKILENNNFSLVGRTVYPITTKKRQEEFLKHSSIKDVLLISKKNFNNTNSVQARQAVIRLKNIKFTSSNIINKDEVKKAAKYHGFTIGNRDYEMRATYVNKQGDYKEEKTVILDDSEETINIIPSILIPDEYIDNDNYPKFDEMQKLTNSEMEQIRKEAKL